MTSTAAPRTSSSTTAASTTATASWRPIVDQEDAARFPHACDDEVAHSPSDPPAKPRLVGLDLARGLALIGMIAVHTISAETEEGAMSLAWILANGKASALFAVLSGVGLAFITGRRHAPSGALAGRMGLTVAVRGLVVLLIGLLVGSLVAADSAEVVLPYLGVMFIAAAVLVPLRTRSLLVIGLTWAVLGPFVSHLVRQGLPVQPETVPNLGLASLASPIETLSVLLFTGVFPAATWLAYVCIGLAIGRSNLRARRTIGALIAGGLGLSLVTALVSWFLVEVAGARDRLAQDVSTHLPLDTFTNYLMFGPSGTLPTDSWWWLAVDAPHTGTPLDLLFTIGVALAVIGACLAIASVFPHRFAILTVPGSMTLTIYTLHVLLLGPTSEWPDGVVFAVHLLLLASFALAWSLLFARGPLEELVARITNLVRPQPVTFGRQRLPSTPSGAR